MVTHQLEEALHELVQALAAGLLTAVLGKHGADVDLKRRKVDVRRHPRHGECSFGDTGRVIVEHRQEHVEGRLAISLGDGRHSAEINEAETSTGKGKQVSGVGIGMVEAQLEDHAEVGSRADLDQVRPVDACGLLVLLELCGRHALDEVHGEDAARCLVPVDLWEDERGVVCECAPEAIEGTSLMGVVELRAQD